MAIITISHSAFGGGREVAERVASVLDHPCISRELLIEASKLYGIPEAKFSEVLESDPHWWKRWRESLRLYRIALQAAMCELAQNGKLVYHGRAGQEFFLECNHVLKVLLIAPMEYRIEQVRVHRGLSEKDARGYLEHLDRTRSRRFRAIFGADRRDPSRYDLVLNISRMNLKTAADLVVDAVQKADFQLDPDAMQDFRDFTITARVQATLAVSPTTRNLDISVQTTEGVVRLYGLLFRRELEAEIVSVVGGISGVGRVVPDFIVTDRSQAALRAGE
jgi:cytidylate kinase